MRILKPHREYPEIMSVYKTIINTKRIKIKLQEFYDPHWLEFSYWVRGKDDGFYILRGWRKIPLNWKTAKLFRRADVNSDSIKTKTYLEKYLKNKGVNK